MEQGGVVKAGAERAKVGWDLVVEEKMVKARAGSEAEMVETGVGVTEELETGVVETEMEESDSGWEDWGLEGLGSEMLYENTRHNPVK